MKPYLRQNEIVLTNNELLDCGKPICDRAFTADEMLWYNRGCLKVQGNDVVIDTVKKLAWENVRKSELISKYSDDNGLIDQKTVSLLSQGFIHPSNPSIVFSLSEAAQISLIALDVKKDSITYPWPLSILGGGYYNVQNAAELDSIAMAALSKVAALKHSGNQEKLWIRDGLRTLTELENYVDTRI